METVSILVVDDEPGLRAGAERALRNYSFLLPELDCEVSFALSLAESGEEALEKIAALPPGIVLLDHQLPGMNGMEVLEVLRKNNPDTLVIVITAYASIEAAVRSIKHGASDFLPKPFTPAELRSAVQKAASRLVLAREARRLAEEKKQIRFEFVRVLGHELKAPLGAVDSLLGLISSGTLGEQIEPYKEIVGRASRRLEQMRKLITDLLDMTRIESGQRAREIQLCNIPALVDACFDLLKTQAAARNITLRRVSQGFSGAMVDRAEVEMILNNLVSNAIKYNREGGSVDVETQATDGRLTIKVRDSGIGIAEASLHKLFAEFTRIRTDKNREVLGSGLGLSIVKKLAQLYGGSVSVKSEADVGSEFTVALGCEVMEDKH